MAMSKLSYSEARLKGIRTWPKTIWMRNRDSDKTASSVAKKNPIPLPLGVMDPAQSWRLRFAHCDIYPGASLGFANQTNRAGSWSDAGRYRLLRIGL